MLKICKEIIKYVKKRWSCTYSFLSTWNKGFFQEYIEKALSLGIEEISFTEHAPLPKGFIDTTPTQDSAMSAEQVELYFDEIQSY